ncbi:redoxin domain-containing protein [Pseudoflavitalea sp. G-6-1-2]|uniref:TlpA disulfide reductase family protein n=1 Tax=Pseudoflavitalea sp. G-6-1-2 TaxID=2728841 RepID=UPI00146C211C|nr:TlpA disulfide reductase family protein [Pseudoflavitalea sp. G-6-1-2]NML22331.1 redoxin domain-containing protein [Pseudoflavitalea sp. G-6-1-2]
MKNKMLIRTIAGLLTIPVMMSGYAQEKKNPAPVDPKLIANIKKQVEKYPDSLPLHTEYIKAFELNSPVLKAQYDKWMKQFPTSWKVPYAIGAAYYNKEYPEASPYLKKVAEMNPKKAEVWQMLSIDAERWGNEKQAHEYMANAKNAAPDDPSYAFYYAMDYEHTDPKLWREALYELANRFPDNERGAQGLYWLATRTTDQQEKRTVYEKLLQLYSPLKFNWSASGASGLYDFYLSSNEPAKALELATRLNAKEEWKSKATLAQTLLQAKQLKEEGKNYEALLLVKDVKAPRYSGASEFIALIKAELADASGGTRAAYDSLLVMQAKTPGDQLQQAINKYATKLSLSAAQVNADIDNLRKKSTYAAPAFSLDMYTEKRKASLADYKGKVVLLTFWFPGCGPCRGEFPHFQEVVNKYDNKQLAYLGINVFPEQDGYVVPFMRGTGYTFTPLRSTAEWAWDVYKVRGQPTNFLIDQEGNIVYSNFMINSNNQRMLELMIESLLKKS